MKNYKDYGYFYTFVYAIFVAGLSVFLVNNQQNGYESIWETIWNYFVPIIGLIIIASFGTYEWYSTYTKRKKYKKIRKNGTKYEGQVLNVKKTKRVTGGRREEDYSYVITYQDETGARVFETPILKFVPDEKATLLSGSENPVICDVYELEESQIAENFRLEKQEKEVA